MSRIKKVFEHLKEQKKCAFIPFITAGDPHLEATKTFIRTLDQAGSSIIEIGIPFSDPVADGDTIQQANLRALQNPIGLEPIFDMVNTLRDEIQSAIVYLIYANMIYHYGVDTFFRRCQQVGVDGVIVPDMPREEIEAFECVARDYGVDMIRLVAPTSKERIVTIAKDATGFLYCVSSMGVTGVRETIDTNLEALLGQIKEATSLPTAIGFGIATPQQARGIKHYTEGVIVGSAIVKLIERHGEHATPYIRSFAEEMIDALR